MDSLIVGLGNPGEKYNKTRHNIGFMAIDHFLMQKEIKEAKDKYSYNSIYKKREGNIILSKPTTFMNQSGIAVKYLMQKHKIPLQKILVVLDDINLPLGKIRIRNSGSAAGHNGIKDIQDNLLTDKFTRLRIGIGKSFERGEQARYVLENFSSGEIEKITPSIKLTEDIFNEFDEKGVDFVMNKYN